MMQYKFVGIDVSKYKLDVCILNELNKHIEKTFDNTKEGLKSLNRWIKKNNQPSWVCLEATGYYSEDVGEFLVSKGYNVSIVNPLQIKYFSKSRLTRNKNDKVDARVIAQYAAQQSTLLLLFKPKSKDRKLMRELLQLIEQLKGQKIQLKNQLSSIKSNVVKKEIKKNIAYLEKRMGILDKKLEEAFQGNEKLQKQVDLIASIKGFGKQSARRFLAYIPDIEQFKNAKQLVAFIGVSPQQNESGVFKGKTRMSKTGDPRLRNTLYMPALVAKNHNAALKPFVERLQKRGLKPKAIVGAVMRKLTLIIFGILKSQKEFDPALV